MKFIIAFAATIFVSCGAGAQHTPAIEIASNGNGRQLDILADGQIFTSYRYSEDIKKPVLWPVFTAAGNPVTRNFPLKNKAGERVDHPHHIGLPGYRQQ